MYFAIPAGHLAGYNAPSQTQNHILSHYPPSRLKQTSLYISRKYYASLCFTPTHWNAHNISLSRVAQSTMLYTQSFLFSFQMLATITAIYVISFLKVCSLTPVYNMQPAYITANIGNYAQFIHYSGGVSFAC